MSKPTRPKLSADEVLAELHRRFDFDPKSRTPFRYKIDHNKMKAGDLAGTTHQRRPGEFVRIISIFGWDYREHNLVWLYLHGNFPPPGLTVDHKDVDPTNNCPDNLRLGTDAQQRGNRRCKRDSTSGVKGVQIHGGSFKVTCCHKYVGCFKSIEEAKAAYLRSANDNFGEFARAA